MNTYKPGDKVLVSKVELPEEKRYLTWPFNDERPRVGEFVHTVSNCNFPTHVVEFDTEEVLLHYDFVDEEVQPFDEDQFDTEGVTAAKNIAHEAISANIDKYPGQCPEGADIIEIADEVIEDLKAAGVVFPDSIKDPHALTEGQK